MAQLHLSSSKLASQQFARSPASTVACSTGTGEAFKDHVMPHEGGVKLRATAWMLAHQSILVI